MCQSGVYFLRSAKNPEANAFNNEIVVGDRSEVRTEILVIVMSVSVELNVNGD